MVVCTTVMMVVLMVMVVVMVMVVTVRGTVGAAFGLESSLDFVQCGSKTAQHFFNHVIGPNTQGVFADFRRKMAIPKVPGEPHQLVTISMPDFHQGFSSGSDPEPSSIVELESVAVGHRDRLR
jgi:hypothetical protein